MGNTFQPDLPVVLAVSGATGSVYGLRLASLLLNKAIPLYLIFSATAEKVILHETGRTAETWISTLKKQGPLYIQDPKDFFSKIASGSFPTRGMVVAPCSMGLLGRVASGTSDSLIERAADVTLKERRRLILLARESPLSSIHLENMLTLSRAGAVIMPPVPAFYMKPESIDDLIHQTLCRVMDLLGLDSDPEERWNGREL